MATYNVYTYSKNGYGICATICRKAMSKEDAIAFKAQRMANPNRKAHYVIVVNDPRAIEQFFAPINERNAQLHKIAEAHAAEMMARREFATEQYRAGRKYTGDIVEFINDTSVCAEVRRKLFFAVKK